MRDNWRGLSLVILSVLVALGSLTACGGGGGGPQPTTSTVTITATSGTLQQTTTISLTVN